MDKNYDFSGWATRNDLRCGDGRVIKRDAFKHNDGKTVSLIWNHDHSNPEAVLGHALLENREEGVYAYGYFNGTPQGVMAKELVHNGDVVSLSIYANKLKQDGRDVLHGDIKELSLVLAGANPGAYIDCVMAHGDDAYEDEIESLYAGYNEPIIIHSEEAAEEQTVEPEVEEKEEDMEHSDTQTQTKEKTIGEILDTMNEEQLDAVYSLVGYAVEGDADEEDGEEAAENEGEDSTMKHNVFENDTKDVSEQVIAHSELMANAIADAKRYGSLKESYLQHASEYEWEDGFDKLFPNPHDINTPPPFIREDDSWVGKLMGGVHHIPFSRVRSRFAQMDEAEGRARGYIKGKQKAEIALATIKRVTTPTTVYIKMKMDRDDVLDITDFDVVAWQKVEMRKNLDRELAQAVLLGDGRSPSSDDKINEQNIRPILTDDELFTIQYEVTDGVAYHNDFNSASDNDSKAKGIIRAAVKARKNYKGSGTPTFFTTEDILTELLLIEDQNGRRIYESEATLATAMRVKEIVTVPEMESKADEIYGIIVNPVDYTVGADKGGSVSMFDDFDIDFNQMKYLMETRMSGALTTPYSAIVLKVQKSGNTSGSGTGTGN